MKKIALIVLLVLVSLGFAVAPASAEHPLYKGQYVIRNASDSAYDILIYTSPNCTTGVHRLNIGRTSGQPFHSFRVNARADFGTAGTGYHDTALKNHCTPYQTTRRPPNNDYTLYVRAIKNPPVSTGGGGVVPATYPQPTDPYRPYIYDRVKSIKNYVTIWDNYSCQGNSIRLIPGYQSPRGFYSYRVANHTSAWLHYGGSGGHFGRRSEHRYSTCVNISNGADGMHVQVFNGVF